MYRLKFGKHCSSQCQAVSGLRPLGYSGALDVRERLLMCPQILILSIGGICSDQNESSQVCPLTCRKMVVGWVPGLTVSLQQELFLKYFTDLFVSV